MLEKDTSIGTGSNSVEVESGESKWAGESYRMQKISTYLPYFDQSFGRVSPQVTFERMSIEGLRSRVTFDVSIISTPLFR